MRSQFIVASVLGVALASEGISNIFATYIAKHGKTYRTMEEYQIRLSQFKSNYDKISAYNLQPVRTSTVGLNKFSDWTQTEMDRISKDFIIPQNLQELPTNQLQLNQDLPIEVNWVEKGATNSVQDQGNCGSCWAFSAVAQMEAAHFIATGELLKLSEQQCLDCDECEDWEEHCSYGCGGGWPTQCMEYAMGNGGLSLLSDYPYIAGYQTCTAVKGGYATPQTLQGVLRLSEKALMSAIAQAPVSVVIDASRTVFQQYTSGVISAFSGCGTSQTHAVLAVGYGYDEATGLDYYLVRNSFGADWGDHGYVKIQRNGDGFGVCGIQTHEVWSTTN